MWKFKSTQCGTGRYSRNNKERYLIFLQVFVPLRDVPGARPHITFWKSLFQLLFTESMNSPNILEFIDHIVGNKFSMMQSILSYFIWWIRDIYINDLTSLEIVKCSTNRSSEEYLEDYLKNIKPSLLKNCYYYNSIVSCIHRVL